MAADLVERRNDFFHSAGSLTYPAMEGREARVLTLVILNNSNRSYVHHIDGKSPELIGRFAPRLHIDDEQVQRKHAELRLDGGRWILEDLGLRYSDNRHGVYVNGRLIGHIIELNRGDQIRIGECQMVVSDITYEPARPAHAVKKPQHPEQKQQDAPQSPPPDKATTTQVDPVSLERMVKEAVDARVNAAVRSATEAVTVKAAKQAADAAAKQAAEKAAKDKDKAAERLERRERRKRRQQKDKKDRAVARALALAAAKAKAVNPDSTQLTRERNTIAQPAKAIEWESHDEPENDQNTAREIGEAMKWWSHVQSTNRPSEPLSGRQLRKHRNGGKWPMIIGLIVLIAAGAIAFSLKDRYADLHTAMTHMVDQNAADGYGRIRSHDSSTGQADEIEMIVKNDSVTIARRHQQVHADRRRERNNSLADAAAVTDPDMPVDDNHKSPSRALADTTTIQRRRSSDQSDPHARQTGVSNPPTTSIASGKSSPADHQDERTAPSHINSRHSTSAARTIHTASSMSNRSSSAICTALAKFKHHIAEPPTDQFRLLIASLLAEQATMAPPVDDHVVYLVDASGSLIDSMPDVICWLAESIEMLPAEKRFTVIFFRDNEIIEVPPYGLKPLTEDFRLSVNRWISLPSGNIEAERGSEPYLALQLALRYRAGEIYILGDDMVGHQSNWGSEEQVLFGFHALVQDRPVRIHTVQFYYRDDGGLFERIAKQYNGRYAYIIPRWGKDDLYLIDPFDEL